MVEEDRGGYLHSGCAGKGVGYCFTEARAVGLVLGHDDRI
jgi:hypothetical protein